LKYRLSWKDKNGVKQFKVFEAKTERAATNQTNKLLSGTKFTDPFLCPDSEVKKICKGEKNMEGKWMYELGNSEVWHGEYFDTREQAIDAGKEELIALNKLRKEKEHKVTKNFQVGQVTKVSPAGVDVDYILENVAENTTEGMEAGEDYLCDVTKEDSDELEQKLNDVLFAWIKEHGYEPDFFEIENEETIIL
jgi:hypothetical protein